MGSILLSGWVSTLQAVSVGKYFFFQLAVKPWSQNCKTLKKRTKVIFEYVL